MSVKKYDISDVIIYVCVAICLTLVIGFVAVEFTIAKDSQREVYEQQYARSYGQCIYACHPEHVLTIINGECICDTKRVTTVEEPK